MLTQQDPEGRGLALTPGLNTESQMTIEIRLITKKSWNK